MDDVLLTVGIRNSKLNTQPQPAQHMHMHTISEAGLDGHTAEAVATATASGAFNCPVALATDVDGHVVVADWLPATEDIEDVVGVLVYDHSPRHLI